MEIKRFIVGSVLMGLVLVTDSALAFESIPLSPFSLIPMSVKIEVKRGKTQTQIFMVKNNTAKPANFRMYATGFDVNRDGKLLFEKATGKYSALDWISIKETEFSIPTNDSKEVNAEISVPRNTKPGEYFAVVMVEIPSAKRTKVQEEGFLISVILRRGCIVRITVPGRTITKKAEIPEIKVEMPGPESKDKGIKVVAALDNKCRVHLDAKGEVTIKNLEGRIFDKFVLQGAGKDFRGEAFVYPEGMRDFWGAITRPLPPGQYIAEASFTYGYRFRKIRAKESFTITEAVAAKQKEFLVLRADTELFELKMVSGERRIKGLKITNLDFNSLKVEVFCSEWIKVEPKKFAIPAERYKNLRFVITIPEGEEPQRAGKIVFKPERGKEVAVDIIVKCKKENR